MSRKSIREAVLSVFPEAKIRFLYDLAIITNWRELEGGKYNSRYTGKIDFYAKLRENDLIDFVTIGNSAV